MLYACDYLNGYQVQEEPYPKSGWHCFTTETVLITFLVIKCKNTLLQHD